MGDEYCDIDADGGIYDLYFNRINDAGNMISITCLEDLEFLENAFNEYNSGNSINWNNHMRITYGYDEEQCLGYIRVICPPNLGRADIENYSMLHGISGDEISFFQGGAGSISADVSYKKDMQNSMLYAEITSPQIDVVYKFYKDDVELSRRTGFMSVITFSTPIAKGRYKVTAHYGSEEVELNSYTINSDSGFNFPNNKNWIYSRTANGANSSHDIVYFDGLGYETQLVNINASGDGMSDVITPIVYDEMYRMTHKYLPYPVKNNEGNFISSAISKQNTYYAEKYPTQSNATSAYAFGYDQYEKSPLNRIEKSFKPGKTYQENALHAETIVYKTNQGSEITGARQIQLMSVDPITGVLTIHNENYDAKTLICKTLTNEDGEIMSIYSDNEGRIILTEQKSTSGSGASATVEYFITRYIYDDFGRLTWVITPEGESYFTGAKTYNKDGANARKYCYIYLYDNHGRLIEKHYPGRYKPEYFVYDRANRLMMRQDGNMMVGAYTETAKPRWMLYKYDALGRLIGEYIVTDEATTATTRFILQSTFDNGEIPLLYNDSAATLLHQYVHDEPAANISWNFVDVSGLTKDGTVSLKDDRTRGLLTYEKLAILESGTVTGYHERTFYYDYKGRVIQTIEKDPQHRFLRSSNKYDYIGNPIRVQEVYIDGSRMDVLERTFEYDSRNRLIKETARINNGTQSIVTFSYDALGNLVGKKYGEGTNAILEQLEYNLQGWVTTKSNDLFEMNLRYYDPIHKTTKYYSGNITEWEWKHKKLETGQSTGTTNCYAFTYDQLSRLTSSEQYIDGVKNKQNVEKMLSYDKNGNLKTLLRYRHGAQSANLSFKYDGNRISSFERNKLIDWDGMIIGPPVIGGGIITPLSSSNVIDFDPVEMDPDLTRDPYKYDKNGNMKVDGLRETSMSYNVLNLLEKVSKGDTIVAKYSYLADGTKLKAVDGDSRGFEYRGSLIYSQDGNALSFESVSFGDGRIVKTQGANGNANYTPHYHLTDHLGSVRVIAENKTTVLERSDYYPLGLRWETSDQQVSDNRYRFNGKEDQKFAGLDFLDYGARMYDPVIGRWFGQDPNAETYYPHSPYAYCVNNPINVIDPIGADIWIINQSGFIVDVIKDKGKDEFQIVDDKGNTINGGTLTFEAGTIEGQKTYTYFSEDIGIDTYDVYKVRGDNNGTALFNFLSDNITGSASKVEIGQIMTGIEGKKGLDFIVTTQVPKANPGIMKLINGQLIYGYTIREINHSHPHAAFPSGLVNGGYDIGISRNIVEYYQSKCLIVPNFHIYHVPSKRKIFYSPNSTLKDFNLIAK